VKGSESGQEEEEPLLPHLTSSDAWLFPVVRLVNFRYHIIILTIVKLGSITLGGLFLVIKYLGPSWINWIMSWYFSIAALYSVPDVRAFT
jgi:minor histocompatibility antigen H13